MNALPVSGYTGKIPHGTRIQLPGSKSILSRVILMSHLEGKALPENYLLKQADDPRLMEKILTDIDAGSKNLNPTELFCFNAATVLRMAAVYATLRGGNFSFSGDPQLRNRPVGELLHLLEQTGAKVNSTGKPGYPPIEIHADGIRNRHFNLIARESSQHVSGMLLAGPFIKGGLALNFEGEPVSKPYIDLTIRMMQEAGAKIRKYGSTIEVAEGGYPELIPAAEADWSAAAFFFAAAAILPQGSSIMLEGLKFSGYQGDETAALLFKDLGVCSKATDHGIMITHSGENADEIRADFTHCPDLFNAFAVAVALKDIPATLTGLKNLSIKESNRLDHLIQGIKKLGYQAHAEADVLQLLPGCGREDEQPVTIDSAGDHRVAMSFAIAGLKHRVIISNPDVVSKSFPGFFGELNKIF
jgi:3-phosphoshikimate 1-carboxyvinyltransferase